MSKYSFEIKTPQDFLEKLHQEHQDFLGEPLSSRHAINCALTAWHLKDWVWAGHLKKMKTSNLATQKDFEKFIIESCPELEIMQCIANGSKHFNQSRSRVESTDLYEGDFSQDFSLDFDISVLEVKLDDGSVAVFDDLIISVIQFWDEFFAQHIQS